MRLKSWLETDSVGSEDLPQVFFFSGSGASFMSFFKKSTPGNNVKDVFERKLMAAHETN